MKKTHYTFWELLDECTIEIPTIQRDYTYGREAAKEISTKLIESILEALNVNNSFLHLDFIYGKKNGVENFRSIERNKNSIDTLLFSLKNYAENLNIAVDFNTKQKQNSASEVITFIPLDGQQRLTTLFLICWFTANKIKDSNSKKILQRFKYSTRTSSKEFLQFITNHNYHFDCESESLRESIENHEDFFSKWTNDPTVQSMLIVLDEIQIQFSNMMLDATQIWKNLTNNQIITFDFFDLDDFELTDELYLKMNARGKKLTHFENFKAWLIKNLQHQIQINEWKIKMDISWNDLFWNEKLKTETKIDIAYLQFFKNMFLGDYLRTGNTTEKDGNIDFLRLNIDFNPVSLFSKDQIFKTNIQNYLEILETFNNQNIDVKLNHLYLDVKDLKQFLFYKNQSLTWWHSTFYYAITRYIIINKNSLIHLNQWIRIISNLIYNTSIESPKLYIEAINSINELIEKIKNKNVYDVLQRLNVSEISFFNERQKEEEILKSKIIINDPDNEWEKLFIDLESHHYFYGQIGFIFNLSETKDYEIFMQNSLKAKRLFSEEIMKNSTNILFRSFLSYGNCFFIKGNTLTFPSNLRGTLRNRNENWRKFIDSNLKFLRLMIDDLNVNENIENQLKARIDNCKSNSVIIQSLVNNPELLNYPENNHIRKYDKAFYLLSKTRIYGFFKEVLTYDWYTKNNAYCIKNSIEYINGKGEDSNPGLQKKGSDKLIIIDSKSLKFKFEDGLDLYESIDEILDIMEV